MNKFLILILVSGISFAQTYDAAGYKWFRGIQNKGSILSDDFTQVVVRDPVTGLYGHVLKSSLGGGGTTPTLQQVLNTGSIYTWSNGFLNLATNYNSNQNIKNFQFRTFGDGVVFPNSQGGQFVLNPEEGLNLEFAKGNSLSNILFNSTAETITVNTANLSLFSPNATLNSELIATRNWVSSNTVNLTGTQTNIGGTKAFTAQTFFNNGLFIGDSTNNFSVTYTPVTGLLFRETNIPRMTLGDRVLVIGNSTSGVSSRLDVSLIDAERTHFLPNKSGTIALTNDTTPLLRVANAAAIPLPSEHAGGVILLVEDSKKMYRNDGTKWQGL